MDIGYWIVLIFCCCLAIPALYYLCGTVKCLTMCVKDSVHESRVRERTRERERMDAARKLAYKIYPNGVQSELAF